MVCSCITITKEFGEKSNCGGLYFIETTLNDQKEKLYKLALPTELVFGEMKSQDSEGAYISRKHCRYEI